MSLAQQPVWRLVMRAAVALAVWALAAALGWWLQRPAPGPTAAVRAADVAASAAAPGAAASPQTMAARVAAVDAMGLRRGMVAAIAAAMPTAAPAAATPANWRLAALVVRGTDRYAVLTSGEQAPLTLRAGELLPDGDRIKAVHAHHIEIQSPRGRLRTLYLIEP